MSKSTHLTLDKRNYIEQELMKNTSFKEIALYLGKDPSSISKEVKKHKIKKECKQCKDCNSVCPDFEDGICLKLKRAPFVCNSCSNRFICKIPRRVGLSLTRQGT